MQAGERRASRGLAIGYFHQHQLDMLDVDSTPLAHLARLAPEAREQELRNYLGGFGFSGDTVNGKVGPMSGGEKPGWRCRSSSGKSLLLLDEPSNHLDVETREALAAALAELAAACCWSRTTGTCCAPRWTVSGSWPTAPCASSTATWRTTATGWPRAMRASGPRRVKREGADPVVDRKAQRRAEAEQRQRLAALRKPLEARLAKVETEMEKLRAKLQALDATIADPDLYSDERRAERQKVMAEHGEHGKRMDELEEQWLELQGSLEEIGQPEA